MIHSTVVRCCPRREVVDTRLVRELVRLSCPGAGDGDLTPRERNGSRVEVDWVNPPTTRPWAPGERDRPRISGASRWDTPRDTWLGVIGSTTMGTTRPPTLTDGRRWGPSLPFDPTEAFRWRCRYDCTRARAAGSGAAFRAAAAATSGAFAVAVASAVVAVTAELSPEVVSEFGVWVLAFFRNFSPSIGERI
jgi:hypothetical protein